MTKKSTKQRKTPAARKKKKAMKGRPRGGASFLCPQCASATHVQLTRRPNETMVVRTRRCLKHGHVFTTEERTA